MSAKNLKKTKGKKTSKKQEEVMDYLDTEKLEEQLLGDVENLKNVGFILENIKSNDDEVTPSLSNKTKVKKAKSPEKELIAELEESNWDLKEEQEGELSLDVYDEKENLVIQAPVAGITLDDIDINFSQGVLTIKGERKNERKVKTEQYLTSECYWGKFSRSIFLPVEVDTKKIKAFLKNGILTVILPKLDLPANVDIEVKKA